MIKKTLISILIIFMMFSVLLLGCGDKTAAADTSEETGTEEESVQEETKEADDAEEEVAEERGGS